MDKKKNIVTQLKVSKNISIKLTQRAVNALKPRLAEYCANDIDIKGFFVRIKPSGSKSYYVRRKVGSSRHTIKKAIGSTKLFKLEEAREEALVMLKDLQQGFNPKERIKKQSAITTNNITIKEVHAKYMQEAGLRSRTVKDYTKAWNPEWVKEIANTPIKELEAVVVKDWYNKNVVTKGRATEKTLSLIMKALDYGAVQDDIPIDISISPKIKQMIVKRYKYKKLEEHVKEETIKEMIEAFEFVQHKNDPPISKGEYVSKYKENKAETDAVVQKFKDAMKNGEKFIELGKTINTKNKIWTNRSRGNASKQLDQTVFHMFLFMITHGTRIWETQRLTWGDLEFKKSNNSVITIPPSQTKTDQILKLPIIPFTNLLFKIRYNSPNKHEKWVFPNATGTNYIDYDVFKNKLSKAIEIGKVTNPDLHTKPKDWRSFTIDTMVKNDIPKDLRVSITNHKHSDAHDVYFRDYHSKFSEILNKNVEFVSKLMETDPKELYWNKESSDDQVQAITTDTIYRTLATYSQLQEQPELKKKIESYIKLKKISKEEALSDSSQDDWSL